MLARKIFCRSFRESEFTRSAPRSFTTKDAKDTKEKGPHVLDRQARHYATCTRGVRAAAARGMRRRSDISAQRAERAQYSLHPAELSRNVWRAEQYPLWS